MPLYADFDKAYNVTRGFEGGYVNDPDDRGGETYGGVARNSHPNWAGWKYVDQLKKQPGFPKNLDKEPALQNALRSFYKSEFWDALRLSEFNNQAIATELFDTGVNMGIGVAARFLQQSLNVTNRNQRDYPDITVDGRIGNITIGTTNNHLRQSSLLKALNMYQGAKYLAICENNASQERFMIGWIERVSV